ncbi:MAG: Flavodoxin reductase (ferredoxin-NADPH reductase) family 1 [Thermoleophilia bacterium]|nr:Flavodoxin reductase (ferredoxin-NADPH reductase) family 1 [Thermoleophilia bacterium]
MHVASLHRYPIKSCRGIEMDAATVERRGFELDRRFMVVGAETGGFRTQRRDPRLALVEVAIDGDAMHVAAEGVGAVTIDLARADEGPELATYVWRHRGTSVDQGDPAAAFFGEVLGAPARLVHMPDRARRNVSRAFARTPDDIVGFADGYPFLVTTTASLGALQEGMDEPVPMDRFRANVVLDGARAWEEDEWSELQVGDAPLAITKGCTRCVITTTDQRTGERFTEPMRTLGATRRTKAGVVFGVYAVPRQVGVTVRVGDVVSAGCTAPAPGTQGE